MHKGFTNTKRNIIVAQNIDDQSKTAANIIVETLIEAINERGRAVIAVSGGSLTKRVYPLVAAAPGVDWSRVHVFWADDRFVEHTNPYSSYTSVKASLMDNAGIPASNIFEVPVASENPTTGAEHYSRTIREFFDVDQGAMPIFDLCINGMGADGHTASLFPRQLALGEKLKIASATHAGLSPWVDRITLTLPVFNAARRVVVVASGSEKARTLKAVLDGPGDIDAYPVQGLEPSSGDLIWVLEPGIAELLDLAPAQ